MNPPKEKDTSDYYRGMADQHTKDLEEIELAVAGYKKRLVAEIQAHYADVKKQGEDGHYFGGLAKAIKIVEETF